MPAYNFKKRFADAVESGDKTSTIRPLRKHNPTVGDPAYLYTGMRTKYCRKLGQGRISMVREIRLQDHTMIIDGQAIYSVRAEEVAQLEGFESLDDLFAFFRDQYGLPFRGAYIEWELINE